MTTAGLQRRVILVALAASAWLGGCDPDDLIRNSLIDRWCGDHPCYWEVVGDIERRPTWHRKDFAVAFLSDDAEIFQVNDAANGEDDDCIEFTTVANVSDGTDLYLEIDFLNDGLVEFGELFPEVHWRKIQFSILAPDWYQGIRFAVRKDGPGTAELAQLSAQVGGSCGDGDTFPVELKGRRPDDAPCDDDAQCRSSLCADYVCATPYDGGIGDQDAGAMPTP